MVPVYFYRRSLLFSICLIMAVMAKGQSSAWDIKATRKGATDKVAKSKHRLKDFKDHLQKWGLDSNYNHALLLGGKLNSNGWSGSAYYLTRKGYRKSTMWQLHFSEIKHEKQTKLQGSNAAYPELGNATPFVYGKINNLYTLQVGYGKQYLLLPGVLEGNLSVSFYWTIGASLAMLKPYYLKLEYTDSLGKPYTAIQKYSSANRDRFLNTGAILGAANWSKGLNEMTYVPGAYIEAAFAIEPGKNKAFIQVITLGANVAFYSHSLPLVADQFAYPYEASLFVGLALGKRWK